MAGLSGSSQIPQSFKTGEEDPEILKGLHKTIRKVEEDIENLKFNTAISEMMIFLNLVYKKEKVTEETAGKFILILSPFAPHLAEELWSMQGNGKTLAYEPWPLVIEEYLIEDVFEYPVSFNGKMRFKITLPAGATREEIINSVLADERSAKWIGASTPSNIIVVPNRIVNIVSK